MPWEATDLTIDLWLKMIHDTSSTTYCVCSVSQEPFETEQAQENQSSLVLELEANDCVQRCQKEKSAQLFERPFFLTLKVGQPAYMFLFETLE